jgi:hypothetical protein
LPPPARSSRNLRAAHPADSTAEAPMLYSRVGRRSSPGFPAEPIAVESVRVPAAPMSERAQPAVPPHEAPSLREASEPPPPTERTGSGRPRPTAPDAFAANLSDGESIAQTLDRLMQSGEHTAPVVSLPTFPSEPPTGPRELFEALAISHVRPVRELLIELRWGDASRDSFVSAAAAVQSLRGAAESLSLGALAGALGAFGDALAGDARDAATRANVIRAYDELLRLLPAAFAFEAEHAQRESFIVQSLVLRVPEAHRTTLERIVSAGLGTIATLSDARPHELADVAGIPMPVAKRIVEAANAYREGRHAESSDAQAGERDRLRALSSELAEQHGAFERVCESWTVNATTQKRELRHAREQTLLAISALLARLGEIPLLERLEKLPFEQKLERLNSYLNEAPRPDAR